jgi:hypothetical protein
MVGRPSCIAVRHGPLPAKAAQLVVLAAAIATGGATYLLLALMLHAPELREIKSAMRG